MLRWDNLIREEYAQELTGDIVNVYDKENTLLHNIEEVYGIELRLSLHLPNGQVQKRLGTWWSKVNIIKFRFDR